MNLIQTIALPIAALPALLAAAPATPAAAPSAQAGQLAAAPVLRFSPATLELGELVIGTPGKGTLTITNASDAPITIEAIKAGCGCTKVSDPPKGPIAPGGSFTVDVTLDPGTKPGVELVKPVHDSSPNGQSSSVRCFSPIACGRPCGSPLPDGDSARKPVTSRDSSVFFVAGCLDECEREST